MAGNLLARYTWLVDTMHRAGRLTRAELNARWRQSNVGTGADLPRRTFYNYRIAVLELFGIEILYDKSTAEYYIANGKNNEDKGDIVDWLLNSTAISGMFSDAAAISDRIFLEQVPSARDNLAPIIEAIKNSRMVKFTYHPFSRSRPTSGVVVEPYLLKLFRQRWYVAGRNVAEKRIKTYALDRILEMDILSETFETPADFNPDEYFKHSFGIVVDSSEPRDVMLKATAQRAKYMRALPLHSSQQEMIHDAYSIFSYKMLITPDFVTELMSLGSEVTVLSPPELRTMLVNKLQETLALYDEQSEQ